MHLGSFEGEKGIFFNPFTSVESLQRSQENLKQGEMGMLESGIIAINREGIFSVGQAERLLPIIRRITQEYSQKVESLMGRLEALNPKSDQVMPLEEEINVLIQGWHEKIKKLGAVPKGLWLVDFDTGDGYFCWKYPENGIGFWHSYNDGFSGRVSVEKWRQKNQDRRDPEPSPTV